MKKAQTLVHYSYFMSARKFMLVDVQWVAYILYGSEIATLELHSAAGQKLYFCAGNLSTVASENIKKAQMWGILPFNGANKINMKVS